MELSIAFGLIYAIISTANYLIQIITVIPSLKNYQLDGLEFLFFGAGLAGPICLIGAVVPLLMPIAGAMWALCFGLWRRIKWIMGLP